LVDEVEEVKDLVRRYIQRVWNEGDATALDELATHDFRYHLGGQAPRDAAGMRQFLEGVRTAFPDWRVEIDDLVADETSAAARWHGRVTHRGVFQGLPPTGRTANVSGINVYRLVGGKIAAEWEQMDSLGLLQQLGVLKA
jgi:steroid delta-isomerase-like uncharacterized protein